jgi:hypothetical protein
MNLGVVISLGPAVLVADGIPPNPEEVRLTNILSNPSLAPSIEIFIDFMS